MNHDTVGLPKLNPVASMLNALYVFYVVLAPSKAPMEATIIAESYWAVYTSVHHPRLELGNNVSLHQTTRWRRVRGWSMGGENPSTPLMAEASSQDSLFFVSVGLIL